MSTGHDEILECLKPSGAHRIEQIAKEEFSLEHGIYLKLNKLKHMLFDYSKYLFTLFWYDMVRFQAVKFRLMTIVVVRDESPTAAKFIPGLLSKGISARNMISFFYYKLLCVLFRIHGMAFKTVYSNWDRRL